MFLHNFWYAAAWDHEIKHEPFGRTVCGEVIVQAAVFAEDTDTWRLSNNAFFCDRSINPWI
jgi:hypothetical protein